MKTAAPPHNAHARNSTRHLLAASLAGTTIEFFDFYIYATAAVLVFPQKFFRGSDPTAAALQSLATFALAFFARPVGSAVFGHFGDRVGRKATLVAALLTMGVSTVAIGLLPTYDKVGWAAPAMLALCRLGQGLGLGGEWGGAVLLATENAPAGRRAWFGMFPQLGAPIGFLASSATFLILSSSMSETHFMDYGWRIPFILSSLLVFVGLFVRLKLNETPEFEHAIRAGRTEEVPLRALLAGNKMAVALGTGMALVTFILFYLLTVFCLGWGTTHLGYSREAFLSVQMAGMVFFGLAIPFSATLADRHGRRRVLSWITVAIAVYGLAFAPLMAGGFSLLLIGMVLGLVLMGMTYGPLGTILAELFPTPVRYSGASISFNLAGIFGASLAPYLATWLAQHWGLYAVGAYLSLAAMITLVALRVCKEPPVHHFEAFRPPGPAD